MPLKPGYSKKTFDRNIDEMSRDGKHTREQAVRVALDWARVSYFKKYPRGFLPSYLALPGGRRDREAFNKYYNRPGTAKDNPCGCDETALKKNPIDDRRTRINKGIKLFEDFTGERGELVGTYPHPKRVDVGVAIGELAGVAYETVRDGEVEKYFHEFDPEVRPLLVSSVDGRQLIILGGEYDFTENGIVDANDEEFSPRFKR